MASQALHRVLCLALLLAVCYAHVVTPEVTVRSLNAPGKSDKDTHYAIRRGLMEASLIRRQSNASQEDGDYRSVTILDSSWIDTTILRLGAAKTWDTPSGVLGAGAAIDIRCTTCYVIGNATIEFDIDPADILEATIDRISDKVDEIIDTAVDELQEYFSDEKQPVPELDISIPPEPAARFNFNLDGFEAYLDLNVRIAAGASYTMPLVPKLIGFDRGIGDALKVQAYLTVDLILAAVEGSIELNGGVHLRLNDGAGFSMAVFGEESTGLQVNGGQFEFLPVELVSGSIVLAAVIRVGAHAGLRLNHWSSEENSTLDQITPGGLSFGAGIEMGVFADLAEFTTNVTYDSNNEDCQLQLAHEYSVAVGATAGATVHYNDLTYGPAIGSRTAIWFTTMDSRCAMSRDPSPTPTLTIASASASALARRQALETETTETTIIYTGLGCPPSAYGNCPPSLQTASTYEEVLTLTTAVPSDEDVTWSGAAVLSSITAVPFGDEAGEFFSSAGVPTMYTPPPPTESASASASGDSSSDARRLAVSVCTLLGAVGLSAVL